MRISDWSSDVCSSDLRALPDERGATGVERGAGGGGAFDHVDEPVAHMGAVLPRKREPRVSGEKACDPGFPPSREHKEARSHVRSCWACRSTAFPTSSEERPFDKLRACPGLDPGANGGRLLRSEERRVGKECVRTCRSRWSPYT